ncbi:MAG TPA: PKD domain-containing protein [Solirubrobacteraceae bacterium]|nr:PKD domain-containing protein [Solirubrobacteraceae bacterium]
MADPAPVDFGVGAAVENINPLPGTPVYSGGFEASPSITKVLAPLEVRAIYVSNGTKAVEMATVDCQAYFAAYQEGPYGIADVRQTAAAQITAAGQGPAINADDIIVQGTHTHSGATLEGIWGPVPAAYLKYVHDQAVAALVAAARNAQPAHLEIGTYDAPWLDNIDTAQTDSYPGWAQDGQVSVLRAVTPSGGSIATYASVPAHPDIIDGAQEQELSPDYLGFARTALDHRLGGVNIVGPATLGREETPVQVGGIPDSQWFAGVVTSVIGTAITDAHWITDPTVNSAGSFIHVPAHNVALFGLNAAWKLPESERDAMWQNPSGQSLYPIDRSMLPPWLTGNVIGTQLTALRIGRSVFLSMPGEPFPEVRAAISAATTGADTIVALSKGQDDWGYFYPAWAWGFTWFYRSDHNIFNVAPQAGDQIILGQSQNIGKLGFPVETAALSTPPPTRWQQALRPGLQAMADPTWGDATPGSAVTVGTSPTDTLPVTFTAIYDGDYVGLGSQQGPVHVDFGDGTSTNVAGDKRVQFTHDFTPGTYTVTFTAQDSNGHPAAWQVIVHAYPLLVPAISAQQTGTSTWTFTGSTQGGDGITLAYRWSFGDGGSTEGQAVTHTFPAGVTPSATLTAADGTTMTASASWSG